MRKLIKTSLLALVVLAPASLQAAAAAPAKPAASTAPASAASAKTKAAYKVSETDMGTLLDDPAAKAILSKYVPGIVSNPDVAMARSMTLAQVQTYAADQLSDEVMAKIQADLDAAAPA